MKKLNYIAFIILIISTINCNRKNKKVQQPEKYIFFIHNKFLEENPSGAYESKYKVKAEYN